MARNLWNRRPIQYEVVPLRLVLESMCDRLEQHIVVIRCAYGLLQIRRIVLAETGMKHAGGSHTHTITVLAEIMRHRRDETDDASGFVDPCIARRSAGTQADIGQRPASLYLATQAVQRQLLIEPILTRFSKRHGLNQRQAHAARVSEGDQVVDLVFRAPTQRNRIDLDRQPRILRSIDPFKHGCQRTAPGSKPRNDADRAYPGIC
jgi:hypothetical protein